MPGRRGRIQKIAHDATRLGAPSPDLHARCGWLLAMSRLHHPDASFQDGRRFVESLATAGFRASRSLVSRWESGQIPVSYEAMTAYERVLGLESGQLSSVAGFLTATRPGPPARTVRPLLDPSAPEFTRRFDELIDAAEVGAASARDWLELAWHLTAAPMVHLRATTWDALADHAVTQLPRSVNLAYRHLSTATISMATVLRAQSPMVGAIATYVSDPAVQVVGDPLSLLDHLPTRESARLVLEVVDKAPNLATFRMGIWLATQKLVRGHFTADERSELHMLVLRCWRSDQVRASEELAELVAALPEGMRSALVQAASRAGRPRLGYSVEHAEDAAAPEAAGLARLLAESAREGAPQDPTYAEDRLLARLFREALFHRDSERRHGAAVLLSASPFAPSAADALLQRLVEGDCPGWLRLRLSTLVRYLCDDSHRLRMLTFLEDPADPATVPLAQGLGHLSFSLTSDQAIRSTLAPTWSPQEQAKIYALGMTASPGLAAITRSEAAPRWQKSAARWWLGHGSSVRA